ncbi:GPR1/FUN34/YaaH family transporter [Streptomyces sp. NWU339]|uniref:GPR1/FUN34/YaaH family transporter n=1 Tax=Streptomyces sp. NWU339 TaxID=2185284 RepID=UPI00215AA208|nr:GPR1/FUN34/YaaH family transporter [Streptomyces sp. NWU339]
MLGFGGFLLGSISLAFYLKDVSVPANSLVASLPIMVFASTIMLLMASVWAMRLGDGVFAAVYGLFGTFWLSFSILSLALNNNWMGQFENIEQRQATANFVPVWAIVIILLTLTTLRLPSVFTLLFVVVSATLLVLFGSIEQAIDQTVNNPLKPSDPWLIYVGITTMFLFIAVGMYIFASFMHRATGAKNLPLGKPLIKSR